MKQAVDLVAAPTGMQPGRYVRTAFPIWQGAASDRGGLKSVTPGWIELDP